MTGASACARNLFQTRRVGAANNNFNEDGNAITGAISWSGMDGCA